MIELYNSYFFFGYGFEMGNQSQIDPRNKLNALTGKNWVQFTKSWFIEDGKPSEISPEIELHPASFPPPMIREFIQFFTKPDQWVLDPFLGTGSTLVACEETRRKGVGIELYEKYAETARSRTGLEVILGDARNVVSKLRDERKQFHLCITSPPYWNILRKTKDYNQQARMKKGLDLKYGDNPADLGLVSNYHDFLNEILTLFSEISSLLTPKGHLVIFAQNIRDGGNVQPLAFDLTIRLKETDKFRYLGERIWLQNQKTLRPYGYPYSFVSNVHHHFCLIFQKKSSSSGCAH